MKWFASVILILVLAACSQPLSIEQQVIAKIRAIESQLEEGERRQFLSNVSSEFLGQGGRMNRDQLRAFVVVQLNRYQSLEARLFPIKVTEITAEEASAEFNALLTGGDGLIPEDGQLYQFRTFWRLEDGDWRLFSADWEPISMSNLVQ